MIGRNAASQQDWPLGNVAVILCVVCTYWYLNHHDDVIKWKHFPRYRPFVRGIHRSPVNSPHKGQCRGALMFSLIWDWINGWVNNREAGDMRRHRAPYGVTVMLIFCQTAVCGCHRTSLMISQHWLRRRAISWDNTDTQHNNAYMAPGAHSLIHPTTQD